MRIVQFVVGETPKIGVLKNDVIIDCTHKDLPKTLVDVLHQKNGLETLTKIASNSSATYPLDSVQFLAPITKPDKILCVGLNYKEHCDEVKLPYPSQPIIFSKFPSTIVGPFDKITHPKSTNALDWEVELVVIIGKKAKEVPLEHAMEYVLGYTVGQDLTARDWAGPEINGGQWLLGKNMDGFCPLGPCVVTKDEIEDPHNLNLKTWVNGTIKQNGTTSELVHRIDKLVSYLSKVMTLLPGDLLMTGTPSGVGFFRSPPESLQPGDLLECEIENIGKLSNRII